MSISPGTEYRCVRCRTGNAGDPMKQPATTKPPPQIARQLQDTALRYFLEVVRCGSIREASQRLNVAGSAISRAIAQLEDLLGTSLFDRHARGMIPSAAGEVLAVHALKSAHDSERAVHDIQ